MLKIRFIQPNQSAYSSPIVIMKKKDGRLRFCIDYRKDNAVAEDETSTLYEALRDLGILKVFTTPDLKSGNENHPYTAFSTPDGNSYEFTVMVFGLKILITS